MLTHYKSLFDPEELYSSFHNISSMFSEDFCVIIMEFVKLIFCLDLYFSIG